MKRTKLTALVLTIVMIMTTNSLPILAANNNWSRIYGDVNGDGIVNQADKDLLFEYDAGFNVSIVFEAADLNGDGIINIADTATLYRYLLGLVSQFTVETKSFDVLAQMSKTSINSSESFMLYVATTIPVSGIEIYIDSNYLGIMSCAGEQKMNWQYKISGNTLKDGPHTVTITAYAPNRRWASINRTFTIVNQSNSNIERADSKEVIGLKQQNPGPCVMYAIANCLRRKQVLNGGEPTITYEDVKKANGGTDTAQWKNTMCGYNFDKYTGSGTLNKMTADEKSNLVKELLKNHPEGIVAYFWPPDTSKVYPHAILIIAYNSATNEFYVADSAIPNTGKISLNDSYIAKKYSNPVWQWLNTLYFIKS